MVDSEANASLVGVIGAGTMGAGIAQLAVQAGHPVAVYDAVDGAAARAVAGHRRAPGLAGGQGPDRR